MAQSIQERRGKHCSKTQKNFFDEYINMDTSEKKKLNNYISNVDKFYHKNILERKQKENLQASQKIVHIKTETVNLAKEKCTFKFSWGTYENMVKFCSRDVDLKGNKCHFKVQGMPNTTEQKCYNCYMLVLLAKKQLNIEKQKHHIQANK